MIKIRDQATTADFENIFLCSTKFHDIIYKLTPTYGHTNISSLLEWREFTNKMDRDSPITHPIMPILGIGSDADGPPPLVHCNDHSNGIPGIIGCTPGVSVALKNILVCCANCPKT